MILSNELYIRASFFKRLWIRRQLKKVSRYDKIISPGSWKNYRSLRSRKIPLFVGTKSDLAAFTDAKKLEEICPTNALKVTKNEILISEKNCIGCQECVKASPEGFFTLNQEKFLNDSDTN